MPPAIVTEAARIPAATRAAILKVISKRLCLTLVIVHKRMAEIVKLSSMISHFSCLLTYHLTSKGLICLIYVFYVFNGVTSPELFGWN